MMVFPGLSPGAQSPINRGKPQSPRGVDTVDSALFAPQNIFHIFSPAIPGLSKFIWVSRQSICGKVCER